MENFQDILRKKLINEREVVDNSMKPKIPKEMKITEEKEPFIEFTDTETGEVTEIDIISKLTELKLLTELIIEKAKAQYLGNAKYMFIYMFAEASVEKLEEIYQKLLE